MEKQPPLISKHADEMVAFSVAPIIRAQLWGFAFTHILIAVALFKVHPTVNFIIANSVQTLRMWGVAFMLVGILTIFGNIRHRAKFLRWIVLAAVFIETTWLIALFIRIYYGGTLLFPALWGLFTYIQLIQYIYYFSEDKKLKT